MNFSAVLLAGGKSIRMGRDKAFLDIGGTPLWRRQIGILRALAPVEIFISGPPRPEWSGFPVVADATPDAGPLAGVVAGLRRCAGSHLVVLAVDLPRMTPEFLRSLAALCTERTGVVPRAEKFHEPLAAVYPKACLAIAEECLASGDHSLQNFVARSIAAGLLRERVLTQDDAPLFLNANTPADL